MASWHHGNLIEIFISIRLPQLLSDPLLTFSVIKLKPLPTQKWDTKGILKLLVKLKVLEVGISYVTELIIKKYGSIYLKKYPKNKCSSYSEPNMIIFTMCITTVVMDHIIIFNSM